MRALNRALLAILHIAIIIAKNNQSPDNLIALINR